MGRLITVAGWLLALAGAAWALGSDDVFIGGFVSQGYLRTDDNDIIDGASAGTAALSEAGLTFSAVLDDRLRVGVQLFARDFGQDSDNTIAVDWAYGDYRFRDWLGVRAGKVRLPFGLYNQVRDLDFLRTGVLLPQSVYAEPQRDLLIAFEGVGGYGNVVLGGAGDLDYEVYAGTLKTPPAYRRRLQRDLEVAAEQEAPLVAATLAAELGVPVDSVATTVAGVAEPRLTFPWLAGASAIWNTPLTGLRLGSTFARGESDAGVEVDYLAVVRPPGEGPFTLPVKVVSREENDLEYAWTASVEFARGAWTLASEYQTVKVAEQADEGWYGLVDRSLGDRLAAQAVYSVYHENKDDHGGEAYVAQGLPGYFAWQKDLALAVRFDLHPRWLIKIEYHVLDGAAYLPLTARHGDGLPERHWQMFLARTTFHF